MFHLICFGWLIFRSESLEQLVYLAGISCADVRFSVLSLHWLWAIVIFSLPLVVVQIMQEISGNTNVILKLSFFSRIMLYSVLLFMFFIMGNFTSRAFIYFQF